MAELSLYNMKKEKVGTVSFPDFLGTKVKPDLIQQVIVAQQTNRRQGTAKVKNRHEVTGSTRKIYRQKGTGRARHGDIKAPLFVGGGRAFGPKPRHYEMRIPQKVRKRALQEALLERKIEGRLWVLEGLEFKEAKTKKAAEFFTKFEIPSALVVLDAAMPAVEKSIRNLKNFKVCRLQALNLIDIMRHDHLIMTRASFEQFVEGIPPRRME